MNWDIDESSQVTFYTGESDENLPTDAFVEMWRLFVDEVLPKNRGVDWDYIRVEFWLDSGRVIVYPASAADSFRIEKAGCQVIFSALLASYDELADSDIDDAEFCEKLTNIENDWADIVEKTAKTSALVNVRLSFRAAEDETAFREVLIR